MKYVDPKDVSSPRNRITDLNVIYDGGEDGISIAAMQYDGGDAIGIRWNISENEWDDEDKIAERKVCLGLPISNSHPIWYILPSLSSCPNDVKRQVKEKLGI